MMLQEKMDARNREEAQEQRLMEAEKEKKRRAHEREKVTKLFTYQIMSYIYSNLKLKYYKHIHV